MVPLSPSPPASAADSLAGGEGGDFDALDFSFLDSQQSVLSTEDASTPPAPRQASNAPESDAEPDASLSEAFDFETQSGLPETTPPETTPEEEAPPLAAPESGAESDASLGEAFDFETQSGPPETIPPETTPPETTPPETTPEEEAPPLAAPESGAEPDASLGEAFDFETDPGFGTHETIPAEDQVSSTAPLAGVGKTQKPANKKTSLTKKNAPAPVVSSVPRKYLFDRSFDYVPPPPPPEPEPEPSEDASAAVEAVETEASPPPEVEEPPPPTFSEEELAAARAAAYADGETAGLQAAMSSIESRTSRTLETLAQQIPALLDDRQEIVGAVAKEAARLAYALTARMMPELARTYGLGEIEAVVRDSLSLAIDQPRLNIRVSPHLAQQLQAKLQATLPSTGFHGHVNLLEDDELGASDVRIEWGDGGAERLVQRAWGELTEIVRRLIGDLKKRTGVEESESFPQKTET